jgi:hypothetical protein
MNGLKNPQNSFMRAMLPMMERQSRQREYDRAAMTHTQTSGQGGGSDGSYIKSLYQDIIPLHKRIYAESLLKAMTGNESKPITNTDFSQSELNDLTKAVNEAYQYKKQQYIDPTRAELLKEAAFYDEPVQTGLPNQLGLSPDHANRLRQYADKRPTDFAFSYEDYGDDLYLHDTWQDRPPIANTLGEFRYRVLPTGEFEVYDEYNFDAEPEEEASKVAEYAAMNPFMRALMATKDFLGGMPNSYGMAYLGDKGPPVSIKLKKK